MGIPYYDIMELATLSCWVTLALIIWFETDAIVHYAKALGLSLCLEIVAYENDPLHGEVEYLDFLRIKHSDSFWINLITCPTCFSVWLTTIAVLSSSFSFFCFPVINLFGLALFFIIKKLY
jgi:hypothetical protein